MPWLVRDALLLQTRWPMGDQRRRNAPFMHPVLVQPEWRVAGIRPADAVTEKGIRAASGHTGLATVDDLGTAAVIADSMLTKGEATVVRCRMLKNRIKTMINAIK